MVDPLLPIVMRIAGEIEKLHDVGTPHQRTARHTTGHDFTEDGHIRHNACILLVTPWRITKSCDDFIIDEQDIAFGRQPP